MFAKRRNWKTATVWMLAGIGTFLLLFLALPVLASEAGEELVPIIDRLPNEVLLFGASGGAIVTMLISVLKHFGVVGGARGIAPQAANFILSVLVATAAFVVGGQPIGAALLTAFTSMVAASGLHETIGHAAAKIVGKS